MQGPVTPSGSIANNGRPSVNPQNRKTSPGDLLGRGRHQLPITRFYSPISSSSDNSQPYSPISKGANVKRRTNLDSPVLKKLKNKSESFTRNPQIVVLSSDDSGDDVFSQRLLTGRHPLSPAVPKSRLNLIRRSLYPVTSTPVTSDQSSSRPKKKRFSKPVPKSVQHRSRVLSHTVSGDEKPPKLSRWRSRILSDTDSEDQVPMENSKKNIQLQTVPLSQINRIPLETTLLKPNLDLPNPPTLTHVKRHLLPFTSSQSVIISSSDDSDFELHNSKQSRSFLSQSYGGQHTSQSCHRSTFLSQANQSDYKKTAELSFVRKPPTTSEPSVKKHSSLDDSSSFCTEVPNVTSTPSRCDVTTSPVAPQKTSIDSSLCSHNAEFYVNGAENTERGNHVFEPLRVGEKQSHKDVSAIYLQDTIPPEGSLFQLDFDETNGPENKAGSGFDNEALLSRDNQTEPTAESPLSGESLYNETTVDPVLHPDNTSDEDSRGNFSTIIPFTPDTRNASTNMFEIATSLPKGDIIQASDEEDGYFMAQDQTDFMQGTKNNRSSLNIELSELLAISHISCSDNSDFSYNAGLDDDDTNIVEASFDMFPKSPEELASPLESFLVEASDGSSHELTSIMNSVMDASADFFSDAVSFGTSESAEETNNVKGTCKEVSHRDRSPTEGIVRIALEVADLEKASESQNTFEILPKRAAESEDHSEQDTASVSVSNVSNELNAGSGLNISGPSTPCECGAYLPALSRNCSNSVLINGCCATNVDEPKLSEVSIPGSSLVQENGKSAIRVPLQPHPCVRPNPTADSCMNATTDETSRSITAEGCTDLSSTNEVPKEIKVVCSMQPPVSSGLLVARNFDKSLIQYPNKPLLLDSVISECQNYAGHVLCQEPLATFINQYSSLPETSKLALHGCLLALLEEPNRWLKYEESSAVSIDDLVSSGILQYLDKNGDLLSKLNVLAYSEITDILFKLGGFPSESLENMNKFIVDKLSSVLTCDRIKKDIGDKINGKFVKLSESALFCIKICLELFVLPLNLNDKLYKTVDIARVINRMIVGSSSKKLVFLSLKTSEMVDDCGRVLSDLRDLCRLKTSVFESSLNDESIFIRVNDVCSSIAVLEFSTEMDPSVKNSPTFRFLMTNYVHALDEQLRTLLYMNTSDVEFGVCIYLGVLLKQNVTGSQHKVRWCRERMRHLLKLFNSSSVFEEFSKILREPVSPVESIVRSEFVSNSFKIKKLGLSLDEKTHLSQLLRPVSHKMTQMSLAPLNSYMNQYSVLTKKPKGRNINVVRANIFENFKSYFPFGAEDNGALLFNSIYLTFWQAIYLNVDGTFISKFQNCPLDWGSEEFFSRRKQYINKLVLDMEKHGLPIVFKWMNCILDQFFSHCCIVDWQLVAPNMPKIVSLLETLGLDKFVKISIFVLGHQDERVLGFPDMVLWNPETKALKFLGLRKTTDQLYPCQTLWLEKLREFDVDAEELQIAASKSNHSFTSGYTGLEQCSQLK